MTLLFPDRVRDNIFTVQRTETKIGVLLSCDTLRLVLVMVTL